MQAVELNFPLLRTRVSSNSFSPLDAVSDSGTTLTVQRPASGGAGVGAGLCLVFPVLFPFVAASAGDDKTTAATTRIASRASLFLILSSLPIKMGWNATRKSSDSAAASQNARLSG